MADVVSEPEVPTNALPETDSASRGALHSAASQPSGHSSAIVIFIVWAIQFVFFTLDRLVRDPDVEGWRTFAARLVVTGIGILLSFAVLAALRRSAGSAFFKRALLALALAIAAAAVHGIANVIVFRAALGSSPGTPASFDELWSFLPGLVSFFSWVHLAVAVVLLSIAYAEDLVRRDRRLAELARHAYHAERAAKRYRLGLAEAAERLDALEHVGAVSGDTPHLWVRRGSQRVRLDLAEVDWIAAEGECVRFHAGDQSFLERMSVSAVAERLAPFGFLRVHRSAVVNSERIESLGRTRWGALQLRLSSGAELRVSKSYQPLVRRQVKDRRDPLA